MPANITDFNPYQPLWVVNATRAGGSVQFTVTVSDSDSQTTAQERDDAVAGLAAALTAAGFSVGTTTRYDVTTTPL